MEVFSFYVYAKISVNLLIAQLTAHVLEINIDFYL